MNSKNSEQELCCWSIGHILKLIFQSWRFTSKWCSLFEISNRLLAINFLMTRFNVFLETKMQRSEYVRHVFEMGYQTESFWEDLAWQRWNSSWHLKSLNHTSWQNYLTFSEQFIATSMEVHKILVSYLTVGYTFYICIKIPLDAALEYSKAKDLDPIWQTGS